MVTLLALGEVVEQQLRAAVQIAKLVKATQVNPAVASDRFGQLLVVSGLGQLVDQGRRGDIADLEPGLRRVRPQPDQQVGLAGAGVPDQAERLPGPDLGPLGQGVHQRCRDVRVRGEVEVLDPFGATKTRLLDEVDLAVLALDEQQL